MLNDVAKIHEAWSEVNKRQICPHKLIYIYLNNMEIKLIQVHVKYKYERTQSR